MSNHKLYYLLSVLKIIKFKTISVNFENILKNSAILYPAILKAQKYPICRIARPATM